MTQACRSVPADLRSWAAGSFPLGAAVELLIRAFDGRFASARARWIVQDNPGASFWLDPDAITPNSGVYSGGERRVLAIVQALATDGMWLDLGDILTGIDRRNLELVLAAMGHAAGSHQHSGLTVNTDGSPKAFTRLPSLFPWPGDDPDGDSDQDFDEEVSR